MSPAFDLYAGVSGLEHSEDSFDLGDGVVLSRTYAHLMAPFTMEFINQSSWFHTAAHIGGSHVGEGLSACRP
jgi:hypothetical protein